MAKKDYKNYSLEDFLLDEEFVRWTINPDASLNYFWQSIITNHPEQQTIMKSAKEMILLFHFEQAQGTSEEREAVLGNILRKQNSGNLQETLKEKRNLVFNFSYIPRVAAVLVFVIVAVYLLNNFIDQPPKTVAPVTIATITKTTQPGQKLLIKLPDGTSVHMNAESSISYPQQFSGNRREVKFSGEAYFDVIEDLARPFLIKSESITTRVLGTSFNLNAYPEEEVLTVALITGKVKVLSDSKKENLNIDLLPNQKISVNKNSFESTLTSFNKTVETGWKEGILIFDNNTYQEAFAKLERWYGVEVDLLNSPKEQWQLKGKFVDMSLTQVLENLKYTHNIKFELDGKNLKVRF
jgi:transmembrane sensor